MSACKWNPDKGDYWTDDDAPCRNDDDGWPTNHCTARRTCSNHVGTNELTCARCLGRVRQAIRAIREHAPLLIEVAAAEGVNSTAAVLAGPAADYRVFSARRLLDKGWIMRNLPESQWERAMSNLLEDDDALHPYSVLTRWQMMLSEDYGHDLPETLSVEGAAAYLERHLHLIAQDPDQDFALFRSEVKKCRDFVLGNGLSLTCRKERGAPCPTCSDEGKFVRLVHEYAHYCDNDDCERMHYTDSGHDLWVCPRKPLEHRWEEAAYRNYLEERTA